MRTRLICFKDEMKLLKNTIPHKSARIILSRIKDVATYSLQQDKQ